MTLKRITAPSVALFTTAEAKAQLRVTSSAEDALIDRMVAAATEEAEHLMGRAVLEQQWLLTLDEFPTRIDLLMPPLKQVDTVKYVEPVAGALTTLSAPSYQVLTGSDYCAGIVPVYGTSWPTTRAQPEAVQVTFTTGYANAAAVPSPIKQWVLARVASFYKHREQWTAGYAIERNEHVDHVLDRYRTWLC